MNKTFVLDTNVLINDPIAFKKFDDNEIIIPLVVVQELDGLKKRKDTTGFAARQAARELDELREHGKLDQGLDLPSGGTLRVVTEMPKVDFATEKVINDHIILQLCKDNPGWTLITEDTFMRVLADSLDIPVDRYRNAIVKSSAYDKTKEIQITNMDKLYMSGAIAYERDDLKENEYVVARCGSQSALCRYGFGVLYSVSPKRALGLNPRNKEQQFLMDALLNPEIKLVAATGMAGTGKTLLAIAAGLEQASESDIYKSVTIARPMIPLGKDVGFLPGTLDEKLDPWMGPIHDSIEFLTGGKENDAVWLYKKAGKLKIEALTYLRGRSLPNQFVIVDECFPYDQHVATNNGKTKIGVLFKDFKSGKDLPDAVSYNEETDEFEHRKIVSVSKKEPRELIEIRCGNRKIKCTKEHPFLTTKGWTKASELSPGDGLISYGDRHHQMMSRLNSDQEQVMLGSLLGDGYIDEYSKGRARLKVIHGMKQEAYCRWKSAMFDSDCEIIKKNGFSEKPAIKFQSKTFYTDKTIGKKRDQIPNDLIKRIDERGLAVLYMDDGSVDIRDGRAVGSKLWTCGFDDDTNKNIIARLKDFDINAKLSSYHNKKKNKDYSYISLCLNNTNKLLKLISPYMHENLSYKTVYEVGKYKWNNSFMNHNVLIVDSALKTDERQEVYDIEVDGLHNFIACSSSRGENQTYSGPVVHNCQNLSQHEVKTIVTRAGEGTKIIFTGDPHQIDSPYLDQYNNGLSYLIDRFEGKDLFACISLHKGERSELAEMAAKIL